MHIKDGGQSKVQWGIASAAGGLNDMLVTICRMLSVGRLNFRGRREIERKTSLLSHSQ